MSSSMRLAALHFACICSEIHANRDANERRRDKQKDWICNKFGTAIILFKLVYICVFFICKSNIQIQLRMPLFQPISP